MAMVILLCGCAWKFTTHISGIEKKWGPPAKVVKNNGTTTYLWYFAEGGVTPVPFTSIASWVTYEFGCDREGKIISPRSYSKQPESVSTAPEKPITSKQVTPSLGTTKILTWDFSAVKSAPGNNYSSIAAVRKGDKLTIMEQSGEWVRVRLENGQEGWIRSDVLE